MINPLRSLRTAVLALGLLGSAAISVTGPLSAHAGNAPTIQATINSCAISITGSNFTPGGLVHLYVYQGQGNWQEFDERANVGRFVAPGYLIGGGCTNPLERAAALHNAATGNPCLILQRQFA